MRRAARPFTVVGLLAAALSAVGCTSAATTATAPSSGKCAISAANAPASFPFTGGRGSVTVTTTRDCTWSIEADAAWIAILGRRTGQGEGVVDYTVSENPVPSARTATLAVGTAAVQLSQAAAPCRYTISPANDSIEPSGGTRSFTVSTLSGCAWRASSRVGWISIDSAASGAASGVITLSIEENSGPSRVGTVDVADQTYTLVQGSPAGQSPLPPPPSPPPPEGEGEQVQLRGRVTSLSGICPFVSFVVNGRTVVAGIGTDYRRGRCGDLSNGDEVDVRGTLLSGAVQASRIEFRDDDD
jgi:hypothetical protein